MRRRLALAAWGMAACYIGLAGRLACLQLVRGGQFRQQAGKSRPILLRAHRGAILDRDGRPLAISLYSGTVGFDPVIIRSTRLSPKELARANSALQKNLPEAARLLELSEAELSARIASARREADLGNPRRFVVFKKGVPLEIAQKFDDQPQRFPGFGVRPGSVRRYGCAESAAHVVGYLGATDTGQPEQRVGQAGLERAWSSWLDGQDGQATSQFDAHNRPIASTQRLDRPVQEGCDILTTVDSYAQHVATQEAEHIAQKYHPEGISIVVADPTNGDLLALVSYPAYDPNPERRAVLQGQALKERCVSLCYEPGSTLKALTIASALDEGVISPQSGFFCGGTFPVGRKKIHCALHGPSERYGHGYQRPIDIMRHSCNVGTAQVGLKLGPDRLYDALKRFGLLKKWNIGLPRERAGRLPESRAERASAGTVARVAFGHAITTTPLHVAMSYAAIANDGVLMQPRLVRAVADPSGKRVLAFPPRTVHRVLKPETSAAVCAMLREVVSNGTGKVTALPGYQVAGKTGTAKKYRSGGYVGSFVGFVPASPHVKPRCVILVVVDQPQGAYYGAEVAAPAFRAIAQRLMAYWRVPEDDPESIQAQTAEKNLKRAGHPTPSIRQSVRQTASLR